MKTLTSSPFFHDFLNETSIVSVTDNTGKIVYANEMFCNVSGYSQHELIGQNHRIINSGFHDKSFFAEMWNTISSGQTWQGEVCNRAKNGSLYWVKTFIKPELDDTGHPVMYYSYRILITERKNAEIAKVELHKQFEKIAEHVPGFIYTYHLRNDGTSCFPYASRGIKDIYCIEPEDVKESADSVFQLLHPDDKPRIIDSIARSAQTLDTWRQEYRVNRRNGKTIWVEGLATPRRQPDNSIIWYGYINDITKRKDAEEQHQKMEMELERERQTFQSLFSQNHEMVFSLDLNGKYTSANESYLKVAGCTLEELLQKRYAFMTHPDDVPLVEENFTKARLGISTRFEIKIQNTQKKSFVVHVVTVPIVVDGKIVGIYVLGTDITDRVVATNKLREQNDTLADIAWMQSHDVRGPVATILGLTNIFNHQNPHDPINKEILERLVESANKLDNVIHRIVTLSDKIEMEQDAMTYLHLEGK